MEEVGLELCQEMTTGESEYACVGTDWVYGWCSRLTKVSR